MGQGRVSSFVVAIYTPCGLCRRWSEGVFSSSFFVDDFISCARRMVRDEIGQSETDSVAH
jgi:hypothetical protein